MCASRQIPSTTILWERHEKLILGVFHLALKMLRSDKELPEAENRINENLCLKARYAYFKLQPDKRPTNFGLFMESQNQPQTDDDLGEDYLRKRPDFKWRLENKSDPDPGTAIRDYDIECKRLGRKLSKKRVLNEEYVENGIIRFLNIEHSYGKGIEYGAMIGYVQNMEFNTIAKEVNLTIKQITDHDIPLLKFPAKQLGNKEIISTSQQLHRTKVHPSQFNLRHIWIDLRK